MTGPAAAIDYEAAARPTLPELLELFDAVGWTTYTKEPEALAAAVRGSSTVVAARSGGLLVGLARVISDGATICYLQDVLVHPGFQRLGVGRELVVRVLAPYAKVRQKVLLTDGEPGQRAFYQWLGYQETVDFHGGAVRAFVRFD
ncbi:GNAT family N-acetyltransferase [Arthrobacter livingstonensis]|uniref:GNAT family N-acetyltransferase n=1 Tax=Arthrobacter livingstonensis TaxID=670078 RepID=A0A2V5L6L5_9MICC|nr:GNAT family N-acetyltransferase [Arthrobacter livingstonensis]PYI66312.1 GNAT family N-acetyltransferase [Arthrobacter livingstonensis]